MKNPTRKTRFLGRAAMAIAFCLHITGCAAIADVKSAVTGDPAAKLDSGLVWNSRVPDIYLPDHDEIFVYFHLRNLSGEAEEGVQEVKQSIRAAISEKGYQLVNRPNDADFTIRCDLRYFGENPCGPTRGSGLYAATKTSSSISDAALVNSVTGPPSSSGSTDGLLGSLMSEGLANSQRLVEWTVLMEFFISERMEGSQKRLSASSESRGTDATTSSDGASRRTQNRRTDEASSQTGVRVQDQFDHECSMTAWANKRRCTREEAAEGYLAKIRSGVREILPDLY